MKTSCEIVKAKHLMKSYFAISGQLWNSEGKTFDEINFLQFLVSCHQLAAALNIKVKKS